MKIVECPRDAMQGVNRFIPTDDKIEYINQLLKVGFDTIDFGSFVSPKAIPQMRDTSEVISHLEWKQSNSKLLAIIANIRGAEQASSYEGITYLGFPLSLSETFQQRNTNKSINEAFIELGAIKAIASSAGKKLVTYLSMGFGNPYGDRYDTLLVHDYIKRLIDLGVDIVSLADTVGIATADQVKSLLTSVNSQFANASIGVHLHATPHSAEEKIRAAFDSGCKHYEGALNGYGGCPMAEDDLVGNLPTEKIISYLENENIDLEIDHSALDLALQLTSRIFNS